MIQNSVQSGSVKDMLTRKSGTGEESISKNVASLAVASSSELVVKPDVKDEKKALIDNQERKESNAAPPPSCWNYYENEITYISVFVAFIVLLTVSVYFATIESISFSSSAVSQTLPGYDSSLWNHYNISVSNLTNNFYPNGINPGNPGDFLVLEYTIKSFLPDVSGSLVNVAVRLVFPFSWTDGDAPPYPNYDGVIYFGNNEISYSSSSSIVDYSFTQIVEEGTILEYPFCVFKLTQDIFSYIQNDNGEFSPLNFVLAMPKMDVSGYSHETIVAKDIGFFETIELVTTFRRTTLSQFYPVLAIICFWLIAIAEMRVTYVFFYRWKKTDNPGSLTLCSGILFALPRLRDSLPGSPPYGSLFDFYSFFWAEIAAVILSFYTCLCWYRDAIPEPKK